MKYLTCIIYKNYTTVTYYEQKNSQLLYTKDYIVHTFYTRLAINKIKIMKQNSRNNGFARW